MNYYVYIHYTKDTNEPFYVGKGKGKRAFSKDGRNRYWKYKVSKHGYYVEIIKKNLSEKQSFNHEIYMIYFLKNIGINLVNLTDGGEGASGHTVSNESKLKMSLLKIGNKNKADRNMYLYKNIYSKEEIVCNMYYLGKYIKTKYINVYLATTGRNKSVNGWYNSEIFDKKDISISGENHHSFSNKKYKFVNKNGDFIECNRTDFTKISNLKSNYITNIINHGKSFYGWALLGHDFNAKSNSKKGDKNYAFNKTGFDSHRSSKEIKKIKNGNNYFIGTWFEFAEKYSIDRKFASSFFKGRKKSCYGWEMALP